MEARVAIADQDLDVLIFADVGMDSLTATLAWSRTAPMQCVGWGHPDRTGSPNIDYFLSSELLEPPNADRQYTEQLVRLPLLGTYFERPVPSLFHSSVPLMPSSARKNSVPFTFVRLYGREPSIALEISVTSSTVAESMVRRSNGSATDATTYSSRICRECPDCCRLLRRRYLAERRLRVKAVSQFVNFILVSVGLLVASLVWGRKKAGSRISMMSIQCVQSEKPIGKCPHDGSRHDLVDRARLCCSILIGEFPEPVFQTGDFRSVLKEHRSTLKDSF